MTACLLRESRQNGGLPHLSAKPVLICLYQGAAGERRQGRIGLNDGPSRELRVGYYEGSVQKNNKRVGEMGTGWELGRMWGRKGLFRQ